MYNFKRKLLILFLLIFTTISVASCDGFKFTTNPETTVIITSSNSSTAITTTDYLTTETSTVITTADYLTTETSTFTTKETTTIISTTYYDESRLVITTPNDLVYTINDTIDYSGMIVTFFDSSNNETILNDTDYSINNVDMSTYGEKTVTITYGEYQSSFTIQVNLPTYYLSAMNLTDMELLNTLRTIIHNGFDGVTYGDARYILDETDEDPNHPGNLIEIYTGNSVPGAWDCNGACVWNREHVWPQSAMPASASNSATNMASDLHNLKPADPGMNSSRGNDYFDWVSQGDAFEPRDEVKGDIARILLYMVVMYDDLSLVDTIPNIDNYEMGLFSVLLEWNDLDPVDDFERHRNDIIESYQHNRNPFIDYPDFADLIWD